MSLQFVKFLYTNSVIIDNSCDNALEKSLYLCFNMKDDKSLIARLNMSDKASFEVLYEKYVGMVYGFIDSVLKNETLAEDLTQWCFMQLWEHRQTISAERNDVHPYLLSV